MTFSEQCLANTDRSMMLAARLNYLAVRSQDFRRPALHHSCLPCAPPGRPIQFKNETKLADGKIPSRPVGKQWLGLPAWRGLTPAPTDFEAWDRAGANCGLRTGELLGVDIDVKISPDDETPAAQRARRLAGGLQDAIARILERPANSLPRRWRDNSTSCAVFFRWVGDDARKRSWHLQDRETGRQYKIELLASGQQIVVAGVHTSGAELRNNLAEIGFVGLPMVDRGRLDVLIAALAEQAELFGFEWAEHGGFTGTRAASDTGCALLPAQAVEREVWRRRSEWVPALLPAHAATPQKGEWSILSASLGRDLEERLAIYNDGKGAHDYRHAAPAQPAVAYLRVRRNRCSGRNFVRRLPRLWSGRASAVRRGRRAGR